MKKKISATNTPPQSGEGEQAPPTVGTSQTVPYAKVRPDPNQPRKAFDEVKLKELADSIAQQGIIQPLLLETVPAEYVLYEPDLTNAQWRVVNI